MDPNLSGVHAAGLAPLGNTVPVNLIGGEFPIKQKVVVLAGGAIHKAGELLGQVTASKKYVLSASASSDGSQGPSAILAHDVDATDGDIEVVVYLTGEFRKEAVTLGTGHTVDSVSAALRDLSIFLV